MPRSTVVIAYELPIPCHRCGSPSRWFSLGIEGCASRCGTIDNQHRQDAADALRTYRRRLPWLARRRAAYAETHPVRATRAPARHLRVA